MLYAISLRHSSTFRVISKITLNSCLCGKVDSTLVRSDPKVLSSNLGPLIIFIFCKYNYMICVYLLKILVIGSKMAFCLSLWYLYLTIGGQGITKESEWKKITSSYYRSSKKTMCCFSTSFGSKYITFFAWRYMNMENPFDARVQSLSNRQCSLAQPLWWSELTPNLDHYDNNTSKEIFSLK